MNTFNSIQSEKKTCILRLKKVLEKLDISRSSLYAKLQKGRYFDPTFPKQIPLGSRSVGWLESEIDSWLLSQAENRKVA